MAVPDLTHLQFLVLTTIGAIERSGREVRERLAEQGEQKTLAAFYQIMARLEDAGFVQGRYQRTEVEGQPVQERWYKVTGAGLKAWQDARDFYVMRRAPLGLLARGAEGRTQ